MGSDRGTRTGLVARCCHGASFGFGFVVTVLTLAIMFWIAWCYFGLTVVHMSDTQRRAVVNYSFTTAKPSPTPSSLPVRSTTLPADVTSINSISKLPTTSTVLRGSSRGELPAKVDKKKEPATVSSIAKGDFASRDRPVHVVPVVESQDASSSALPSPRGPLRTKDEPQPDTGRQAAILSGSSSEESEEDRIYARRVMSSGAENRPEEKNESDKSSSRRSAQESEISPTKVFDTETSSGSSRHSQGSDAGKTPIDEVKTQPRDYMDRDKITPSRRDDKPRSDLETGYREPDFDREYPRRYPAGTDRERPRYDDIDDERGSRSRYDQRNRGRDKDDRFSKGDTRVYPDDRPLIDDRSRDRVRERYPEDSPRRGDDGRYDDRYEERPRYRDRDIDTRNSDKVTEDRPPLRDDRYRDKITEDRPPIRDDRYRDRVSEDRTPVRDDKYRDRVSGEKTPIRDDRYKVTEDRPRLRDDRYRDDDPYRSRSDDRYRDRDDDRYRPREEDRYRPLEEDRYRSRGDERYRTRDEERYRDDDKYVSRANDRPVSRDDDRYVSRDDDRYVSRDDDRYISRDDDRYRGTEDRRGSTSRYKDEKETYRPRIDEERPIDLLPSRTRESNLRESIPRTGSDFPVADRKVSSSSIGYESRKRDSASDYDVGVRDRPRSYEKDDVNPSRIARPPYEDKYRDDERRSSRYDEEVRISPTKTKVEDSLSRSTSTESRPKARDEVPRYVDDEKDGRKRDDRYVANDSPDRNTRIQDSRGSVTSSESSRRITDDRDAYKTRLPNERQENDKVIDRREEVVLDHRSYASDDEYRRTDSRRDYEYEDRSRMPNENTKLTYRDEEKTTRRDPVDDEEYKRGRNRENYDRDRTRNRDRYFDEDRKYDTKYDPRDDDRYTPRDDRPAPLPIRKYDTYPDEEERIIRRDPEPSTMRKEDTSDRLRPVTLSRGEDRYYSKDEYSDPKPSTRRRYDDDLSVSDSRDDKDDYAETRRRSGTSRQPASARDPMIGSSMTSVYSREPSDVVLREKRFQVANSDSRYQSGRVSALDEFDKERSYLNSGHKSEEEVRPLTAKDVIDAAMRHSDTSGQNRNVYYPVFDPRVSNLTSPEIIRPSERRGTTITAKRRRST